METPEKLLTELAAKIAKQAKDIAGEGFTGLAPRLELLRKLIRAIEAIEEMRKL